MTKSSDQRGENERYINRSLSLDGIGEAGCILKYAEATITPSPPYDFPRAFIVVVDCTPPRTRRRAAAAAAAIAQLDQIAKPCQKSDSKIRETD
jgi:hypothetical protein